jgi:hypothetical protein
MCILGGSFDLICLVRWFNGVHGGGGESFVHLTLHPPLCSIDGFEMDGSRGNAAIALPDQCRHRVSAREREDAIRQG